MPEVTRLPGRLDGVDGLLELAKTFGAAQVFELIMLCRTTGTAERDAGGQALTALAGQLVDKVQDEHPEYTEIEARRAAAAKVGFMDWQSRSNFSKILAGGRRNYRNR